MKKKHVARVGVVASLLFGCLVGCKEPTFSGTIPVNEDSVRDHILPIEAAVGYTKNFRIVKDSFSRQLPNFESSLNLGLAEAFNRDAIAVLLNQKDAQGNPAAGVRIYYGLDRKGQVRMVLVPYDSRGNDIINQLIGNKSANIPGIPSANAFAAAGQTVEEGQRCPTLCDNGTSGLAGN
jgi:hypothetical protein